jgi:hypothetical protein
MISEIYLSQEWRKGTLTETTNCRYILRKNSTDYPPHTKELLYPTSLSLDFPLSKSLKRQFVIRFPWLLGSPMHGSSGRTPCDNCKTEVDYQNVTKTREKSSADAGEEKI